MPNPLAVMPQGAEWLVILAIVVLVFGAAKLPDLARSSGQALRIFKTETKGLRDGDSGADGVDQGTAGATTPPEQREIEARNRAVADGVVRRPHDDTTA
jgi:sec-independent protein translocase protein TatA